MMATAEMVETCGW